METEILILLSVKTAEWFTIRKNLNEKLFWRRFISRNINFLYLF
jgi:hypothetical protein